MNAFDLNKLIIYLIYKYDFKWSPFNAVTDRESLCHWANRLANAYSVQNINLVINSVINCAG